jgi:hypothetical protein
MTGKMDEMVLKHQYDLLPKQQKLQLRDEFLEKSGMSLITFYQKLRTDKFRKLERDLFVSLLTGIECKAS